MVRKRLLVAVLAIIAQPLMLWLSDRGIPADCSAWLVDQLTGSLGVAVSSAAYILGQSYSDREAIAKGTKLS